MLPELEKVAGLIESQGYHVEPKGMENFTLDGERFVKEAHGDYTSAIYGIYIGEEDVGTIFEKNFVITKYFSGRRPHHTSVGIVFLDTRGGRHYSGLKYLLEANDVVVCNTMPKEEDLEDGQGTFVEPGLRPFNPIFG